MKITTKKIDNNKVEVHFEVSAEELDRHIKETKTLAEASEALIKASWQQAVQKEGLEPIGPAQTSIEQIVPGQLAKFKITAPVLPEIKLPDYASLIKEIKKEPAQIKDDDIEQAIKSWQLSKSKFTTLERPAEKGDFVQVEFSSSLFPGDQPQQDRFILGEGRLIPGFEEQLVGLSANQEKSFNLTYPDPYFASHLAGKEAQFKVKMIKVEKVEKISLEELIKNEGAAETIEELHQKVRMDMEHQAQHASEQRWRQQVIDRIAEASEMELPTTLIEYEQMRLIESLKRQVADQLNLDFEDYLNKINQKEEDLKKTYRMEAERNVRQFLVIRALQRAEQIEVSEDEIIQEAAKIKEGMTPEEANQVDQTQLRAYTKDALTRDKLFQKLSSI